MERREFLRLSVLGVATVATKCIPEYTGGKRPSNVNAEGSACPPGTQFVGKDKAPLRTDGNGRIVQWQENDLCLRGDGSIAGFVRE